MGEKGLSELYNRDFERRIIGAVLINPDVIDEVIATHLEPYDFYFQDLRAAYTAITRLWQAKESIHVDTIAAEMGDAVENSTDFLIKIYDATTEFTSASYFADKVKELAVARKVQDELGKTAKEIYEHPENLSEILDKYQKTNEAARKRLGGLKNDPWRALTPSDFYKPIEPIRYIVDGIFERGSLNILYGAPGTLKSFLMQDLAVCVASGKPWLTPAPWGGGGKAIATTQGKAMWLDFDMGKDRTLERFAALGRHYGLPSDAPMIIYSMQNPPLNAANPDDIDNLIIRADSVDLIVIDNLHTISGGIDENTSDMGNVMFNLRTLAEMTRAAVVVIHHERKSPGYSSRDGESLRGHSSIEAAIDLALKVEREPYSDTLTIKSTKTRGAEVHPITAAFTYELMTDSTLLDTAAFYSLESEDTQSDYAIEREIKKALEGNPMNQKSLWQAVSKELPEVGRNRIIDHIRRLEAKGTVEVQAGVRTAKIYSLPACQSLPELAGKLD
jgi:replicative DNA helicase